MHLGKRQRNSFMRRTTSMASLGSEEKEFQSQESPQNNSGKVPAPASVVFRPWMIANFLPEPTHFLHACFRCRNRLRPGRDIYMYRGDAAFCSAECRTEQIFLDEFMAAARKKQTPANSAGSSNPRQIPRQRQQGAADV